MKNKSKRIVQLTIFLLMILLVTSCRQKVVEDEQIKNQEEISVYFINQVDDKLVAEQVFSDPRDIDTNEKKVQVAINAIRKGPQSTSLLPVLTSDVELQNVELHENGVKISVSEEYHNMGVQKQMIMRASFVRTLTSFPFIHWVEFQVDHQPLLSTEGQEIGPIFRDDIVLVQPDPKPPTNVKNIVLYFSNSQATGLVAENRKIQTSVNIPLEQYIVEELIKGPQNQNYHPTVPMETTINAIKTKDGVCQVDLSAEFKTKHPGGSTGELFTIYSIVNSLTESSVKVKKVAFLIDGKKMTEYKGHVDLSILFERDESLIEDE